MIAHLQGIVSSKGLVSVVLDMGGLGVEVLVTRAALERCHEGELAYLVTRLIVREDALTLFGFANESERDAFDALLKVNGVGPRMALLILSNLTLDHLRNAVATEKADLLTRVPGIGKKTAQKIVLELKDKLPGSMDTLASTEFFDSNTEVIDALVALGFSIVEAQMAVQALPADAPSNPEERIRLALQAFDR